MTLRDAVGLLRKHYGSPVAPPATDPFALILWETVVYLAPAARRREAFEDLSRTIGTTPAAILKANRKALERVTARGILRRTSAEKLRTAARIALEQFDGDLTPVIRGPIGEATRALRLFPGIGEPGAEKILLLTGRAPLLAPDSNGLRVLVRVGLVHEGPSYAKTYAHSRDLAPTISSDPAAVKEAHLLLQQHGQTLCKRTVPRCGECPLAMGCAYALSVRGASRRSQKPPARRQVPAPAPLWRRSLSR
jgi:endonuclease III